MNIITKLFNIISGRDIKPNRVNEFEILFGHNAAGIGEHGAIVGTWVSEGSKMEITIPYVFKGRNIAPKLTVKVLEELFHHARMVGIVPSHLASYNGMSPVRQARR